MDWETDSRPFGEILKAWRPEWSRDRKAAELRTQRATFDGWAKGRSSPVERSIRRLMTLIDAAEEAS